LRPFHYFRGPFPSQKGFSAYRMPGMAVHGPFIFALSCIGFLLCWPHPSLRVLVIVWVLAGLYLGRDIAILCHYNPLLTLISWAAFAAVLFKMNFIARFGAAHILLPAALSVGLGLTLLLVAFLMTRERVPDSI
jgi:hypothetical protein